MWSFLEFAKNVLLSSVVSLYYKQLFKSNIIAI